MNKENLQNLENSINILSEEVSSLNGKINLLSEQFNESEQKLRDLKELQDTNKKAVELLNLVSKVTTEIIKEMFEQITTNALNYIHQSNDYKFALEFDRHGNIPTLKFNVKTPDMQESHDILDCRGGGTCDVVSLALRLVLLEISKMPGFLFLDEPEKHLDSPETLKKMIEFIKEMQKDTKRQIFWITHKEEVVQSVVNPIILTNQSSSKKEEVIIKKKKRGRPKKSDK